jgi:arylsulfatase A-like enzyme
MKQPNLNRLNGRNATDAGGPLMQAALPGLRASAVRDLGRGISHHAWTQGTQGLSLSPVSHRIECVATARNGDAGTETNNTAGSRTLNLWRFDPAALRRAEGRWCTEDGLFRRGGRMGKGEVWGIESSRSRDRDCRRGPVRLFPARGARRSGRDFPPHSLSRYGSPRNTVAPISKNPPLTLLIAALLAPLAALRAADEPKPNIIVILADDLGYGDVGCYGATKIKTPNIDRLASEGRRFTDAHSPASVCSPSRYGLLSGRYPWRLHQKNNDYHLEQDRMNVASMLKTQGYRSAAIGKWHLGYSKDWNKEPITGPLECGFDYHFGVPQNHNDPYRAFIENHNLVGRKPGEAFRVVKGRDFPEGLAEPRVDDLVSGTLVTKALHFIEENRERPFFLYFTSVIPHTHITPAERFRGKSAAGLYGDYVQELDDHVGRILAALERFQLNERTLVCFTSDNGSAATDFKGSQNVQLNLASEAGGVREKFTTAKRNARALGHVANGPWHDGKGTPFEGGHRVPFIARWPGQVPAGTVSDETICFTDLLATAAAMVNFPLPHAEGGDSFNILPALRGEALREPIRKLTVLQGDTHDDALAVRSGRWKLIDSKAAKGGQKHQLYDLLSDPGETKNIAAEQPDIVKGLAGALAEVDENGRSRP